MCRLGVRKTYACVEFSPTCADCDCDDLTDHVLAVAARTCSTLVTPCGDRYPFLATELMSGAVTLDRAVEAGISVDALLAAWKDGRDALDDIHGLGCVCYSQQ
jgi:hypothetical protein